MSYKRIGSFIHNWSHSFLSLMNYVDDDYIIDELSRLLSDRGINEIVIDPLNKHIDPERARTKRLLKSLGYWTGALPQQRQRENVLEHELATFRLHITRPGTSLDCVARATDDRGKEYKVSVVAGGD